MHKTILASRLLLITYDDNFNTKIIRALRCTQRVSSLNTAGWLTVPVCIGVCVVPESSKANEAAGKCGNCLLHA